MKTLTSAINTEAAAEQSGWAEFYDFYLKDTITTPYGSASVIRINNSGVARNFFKPNFSPELDATQGDAASYSAWPVQRKGGKSSSKFANDKMTIGVSNVTAEWAQMLADVDWRGVPVVIRKVNLKLIEAGTATEDDYAVIANVRIDSARVTLEQIQFSVSSDLGTFQTILPREEMHTNCRAKFGDALCGVVKLADANSKPKTATSGSSTTVVKSSLTGHSGTAVTADDLDDTIVKVGHGLSNGHRVRIGGTTLPGGLTRGLWYFVVNKDSSTLQLSLTHGGSAVDITSAGSGVTMDSESGFDTDTGTAPWRDQSVTADSSTDKITLTAHGLANGDRVTFGGTTLPGGLTAGVWYWVVSSATNDFKVSLTEGGSAVDITSNGTSVTVTSTAPYGTDQVDALSSGAITTSSEQSSYEGYRVRAQESSHWKFASNTSNPTPSIDIYAPYFQIDFGSAKALQRWEARIDQTTPDYLSRRVYTVQYSNDASTWHTHTTATGPVGLSLFTIGLSITLNYRYWRIIIRRSDGGALLYSPVSKLYAYTTTAGGTDQVNATADGNISGSSEKTGSEAKYVKSGNSGVWLLDHTIVPEDFGKLDWGSPIQGYWQIADAQAGLANPLLKPYITFDFGSAKALKLWRFRTVAGVERNEIPRILQIYSHSSSDFSTGTPVHEMDHELPPVPDAWSECRIHAASSKQYWRICVRNLWSESIAFTMLQTVQAFTGGRNYWMNGRIRFEADTATAALQGISRRVIASYSGQVECEALPTAPASGDRFRIERGCPRDFNGCCERLNLENFAGFTTLPAETVVR